MRICEFLLQKVVLGNILPMTVLSNLAAIRRYRHTGTHISIPNNGNRHSFPETAFLFLLHIKNQIVKFSIFVFFLYLFLYYFIEMLYIFIDEFYSLSYADMYIFFSIFFSNIFKLYTKSRITADIKSIFLSYFFLRFKK